MERDARELPADVDDVDPSLQGAADRVPPPAVKVADVGFLHGPRLHRFDFGHRPGHRADRHLAGQPVGVVPAAVGELDPEQGVVRMDLLASPGQDRDVVVVPQCEDDFGKHFGVGVDAAVFGVNHRPTTLGLDAAHPGMPQRPQPAHAVALAGLVEPVAGHLGADPDRLEQDVVAGIAGHLGCPPEGRSGE